MTAAETKHTVGEWFWCGTSLMASCRDHSETILVTKEEPLAPSSANAAFIVRACNAYDDMLAALQEARTFLAKEYRDPSADQNGEWLAAEARPIYAAICAAVSKAEGRS